MLFVFLIVHLHILHHVVTAHQRGELVLIERTELIDAANSLFLAFIKQRPCVVYHLLAVRLFIFIIAVAHVGVQQAHLVARVQLVGGKIGNQRRGGVADTRRHQIVHLVLADDLCLIAFLRIIEIGQIIGAVTPTVSVR